MLKAVEATILADLIPINYKPFRTSLEASHEQ